MMKMRDSLIGMIIGSFLINYFFMPLIMVDKPKNIRNSIGKAYISLIMGLTMALLEVAMDDIHGLKFSTKYYIPLVTLLMIMIVLYRYQIGIDEKQYVNEMIEHHAMALNTTNAIVKKTHDYNVMKLGKKILQNQSDELREMHYILENMKA